jgi:hypothetical protein
MQPLEYICDRSRHLICLPYSIENLHRMARELGLTRGWYHGGSKPHYDIPGGRMLEVIKRCRVVSSREIVRLIRENRD